jgi:hypothetical protein
MPRVAQVALELATALPELVSRNPGNIKQAWAQMRADRAAFVEFFDCDEMVLPRAEAEERINAFYQHRQEAALGQRTGRRTSLAWTCPPSSFRPNSPTLTLSASSTTKPTG